MSWSLYMIQGEIDGRLYTGMTQDVNRRVHMHNRGKVRSTKGNRPCILAMWSSVPIH
jgi:putative endonuclease